MHAVLDRYIEAGQQGYHHFVRTQSGPARLALLDAMQAADEAATALPIDSDTSDYNFSTLDEVVPFVGAVTQLEATLTEITDASHPEFEGEEEQQFAELFDRGIEAYFPEGIAWSEKARLFELAQLGNTNPPKGHTKADNRPIYEARADFIEGLTGKRFELFDSYQGIHVSEILQAAVWLYGDSDETVQQRGWTITPRDVFTPNLDLMRFSAARLEATATQLAELTGMPIEKVFSAHRGLYRFSQHREVVAGEMRAYKAMGIDTLIARRPDILDYPIKIIREKERAYMKMGIPLSTIRSHEKFYVYRPETIQGRIDTFQETLEHFADYLDPEEATLLMQEFKRRARVIIDCGEDKIKTMTRLIRLYGNAIHWDNAINEPQPNQKSPPQVSMLLNLARVSTAKLTAHMAANPEDNIFIAARRLVNAQKKTAKQRRQKADQAKSMK